MHISIPNLNASGFFIAYGRTIHCSTALHFSVPSKLPYIQTPVSGNDTQVSGITHTYLTCSVDLLMVEDRGWYDRPCTDRVS